MFCWIRSRSLKFRLISTIVLQAPIPLPAGIAPGPAELHAPLGTVPAAAVARDPTPQTPGATVPLPQPSVSQLPALALPYSGTAGREGSGTG